MIYITGDCHGGFDRFENDKFSNFFAQKVA